MSLFCFSKVIETTMKIILFVAVAFVAGEAFAKKVTTTLQNPLEEGNGGGNNATFSNKPVEGSKKAEDLIDTLNKFLNGTYPIRNPKVVTSCFTKETKKFENDVTALEKMAQKASEKINKVVGEELFDEPLKKFVDSFADLKTKFWSLIIEGNYKDALEVDEGVETVSKGVLYEINKKLSGKNDNAVKAANKQITKINELKKKRSRASNKRVMVCIAKAMKKLQQKLKKETTTKA